MVKTIEEHLIEVRFLKHDKTKSSASCCYNFFDVATTFNYVENLVHIDQFSKKKYNGSKRPRKLLKAKNCIDD